MKLRPITQLPAEDEDLSDDFYKRSINVLVWIDGEYTVGYCTIYSDLGAADNDAHWYYDGPDSYEMHDPQGWLPLPDPPRSDGEVVNYLAKDTP